MKIIITEKQAKKLNTKKINCGKCDHSWDQEPNDKHSNLCHMCGWDNDTKSYNDKELFKFWEKESTINEIVDPVLNLNSGNEMAKYLTKRIPFLKYMEHFVNDNREDEGIVKVQFQNVTYNEDVEMVKPTNEGMMKLEFRGLNTVVEVHYYKSPMGGSRSEPTRYRYSIGYRFDLVMMFKNKPNQSIEDELFERVFMMATKQSLENKYHYNNEVFTEDTEPPKEFLDESINEISKRFLMTEEFIENLPVEIQNPFSGYSDKEITEALSKYFKKTKKRQIR